MSRFGRRPGSFRGLRDERARLRGASRQTFGSLVGQAGGLRRVVVLLDEGDERRTVADALGDGLGGCLSLLPRPFRVFGDL